jgi:general secretion pathway protein N
MSVWGPMISGLLLGALCAGVAFAPARWTERMVNTYGDGHVRLADSAGTVWEGSARLILTGGEGSRDAAPLAGRVHWHVSPGLRAFDIALNLDCCTRKAIHLRLLPGLQSWQLRVDALESFWPANMLTGLGTPWNTLQMAGALALSTPGFTVNRTPDHWNIEGSMQLDALDMGSPLSSVHPLGSYRAIVRGGAQPEMDLSTLSGALQLSGHGRWTNGALRFEGDARAQEPHAAELSNLLNIMGRRDGARSRITLG